MAKVTLVFAALLIALGLAGFLGTGSQHHTALIPAWFGLALGIFGWLAISPSEKRRKLFMHINVTIGLLGFMGGASEALRGYRARQIRGRRAGHDCAGLEADHGRAAADLRHPLRAVVHRRAPFGEGLTHGRYARWIGREHARRALAARQQRARGTDRPAQTQAEPEKAVAADMGAGGAAQGAHRCRTVL